MSTATTKDDKSLSPGFITAFSANQLMVFVFFLCTYVCKGCIRIPEPDIVANSK